MLPLRIAARFLWKSKAQSLLIMVGIAVGIGVQVFVGSLITSLQDSLIEATVGSSPHVSLSAPESGEVFTLGESDLERLRATDLVTAVSPQRVVSVLAVVGETSVPLVVKGGAAGELNDIYGLDERLTAGEADLADNGVAIGTSLAEEYGLGVGDPLELALSSGERLETTVAAVFDLGAEAANEGVAFADADLARRALGVGPDEYSVVETQISDVFASGEVAAEWRRSFPSLQVTDWQEENEDLLSALQSQSASSNLIQVFVVLAVMIGIASTLAISAVQKTQQIGILKALGMADRRTGLIFLLEAGILGAAGTGLGIALALGLIALFSGLAGGGDDPLVIEPRLWFVLLSAGIGISIALISAVLPYRRTSRLDPIEVIQG